MAGSVKTSVGDGEPNFRFQTRYRTECLSSTVQMRSAETTNNVAGFLRFGQLM